MSQNRDRGPTGPQHPPKVLNKNLNDQAKDVSTTSGAYNRMLPRWELVNTLLGGTEAMREAGEKYLPAHQHESPTAYKERRAVATLLNYTAFTLNTLTGKAFKEPPVLGEEVDQQLVDFIEDVDGAGTGLQVFAQRWFKEGLGKAFAHVLVDFTRVEEKVDAEGKPAVRTKADDAKENIRPYWVLVSPENLIFAHADLIDGREVYTHVRLKEWAIERVGYAEVLKERIRVLEPGTWELFEKDETVRGKNKWVSIDRGTTTLDYIPLVTFYTSREGTCEGRPPMDDLAWLNVSHFQSSSDQRNILTVSRFPILAVSGAAAEDDSDAPLVIGPKKFLSTADPQGKFYFVEHTGAAIESGRNDLSDLEEQMSIYGAAFLKEKPGSVTATGRALDSAESLTPLQAMGLDFKDAMELALRYTADWLGLGEEADTTVIFEVGKDLDIGEGKDLDVLDKARVRKDISRVAYISELKRRSILDEDYDPEDDQELIDEERESEGALAGANALLAGVEDPDALHETRAALKPKPGKKDKGKKLEDTGPTPKE